MGAKETFAFFCLLVCLGKNKKLVPWESVCSPRNGIQHGQSPPFSVTVLQDKLSHSLEGWEHATAGGAPSLWGGGGSRFPPGASISLLARIPPHLRGFESSSTLRAQQHCLSF